MAREKESKTTHLDWRGEINSRKEGLALKPVLVAFWLQMPFWIVIWLSPPSGREKTPWRCLKMESRGVWQGFLKPFQRTHLFQSAHLRRASRQIQPCLGSGEPEVGGRVVAGWWGGSGWQGVPFEGEHLFSLDKK